MINKIKKWFQQIVADETKRAVGVLEGDSKALLDSHATELFSTIESRFVKVADEAIVNFKSRLDSEVKTFEARITKTVEQPGKADPAEWHTSPEQFAAERELIHPRPSRR